MALPTVVLRGVRYRYPDGESLALDDISWCLEPGLHVVAGASGSGKSTLLRALNGLVPHFHGGTFRGDVHVAGHDVVRTSTRRMARDIGFVFQDPEMQAVAARVARDVAFALTNAGIDRATMRRRVGDALERVGLAGFEERSVGTLSGGERQRMALASVTVTAPAVLVLDEPLSQLDDESAAAIITSCRDLAAAGTTVIVAEHRFDLLPADLLAHRVHAGSMAGRERAGDIVTPPSRPASRRLGAPVWQMDDVCITMDGATLLSGVSLAGRGGEIVALTGRNGSGKTTLLRALAGLLTPSAGSVRRAGRVAYLPQNPGVLLHGESVADEIETTLRHCRSHETASEWLAAFSLEHLATRYPRDLSSGQRQRAAIATVLAARPEVVLLDEPTRGMDDSAREQLARAIDDLARNGSSIVIATHDSHLITSLAATAYRLTAGRVEMTTDVPEGAPA